jgi:hypothetical protein
MLCFALRTSTYYCIFVAYFAYFKLDSFYFPNLTVLLQSSVLLSLLGDMICVLGKVSVSGKIAYVGQRPFIQNSTLKGEGNSSCCINCVEMYF